MQRDHVLQHAVMGAAAGVLGTFVISTLMKALGKPVEFGKGVGAAQKVLAELF